MIEHDLDMISNGDYILDMGPGSGKSGGQIVASGTPEEIAENPNSLTGQYLKDILYPLQNDFHTVPTISGFLPLRLPEPLLYLLQSPYPYLLFLWGENYTDY